MAEGSPSPSFLAFMVNLFLIKRKRGTKLYVKRKMLSKKKKKGKVGWGEEGVYSVYLRRRQL